LPSAATLSAASPSEDALSAGPQDEGCAFENPFGDVIAPLPFASAAADEAQEGADAESSSAAQAGPPSDARAPEPVSEIFIEPLRRRGSVEISAMLLVGFLLLTVTAAGQVFRSSPPETAKPAVSTAPAGDPGAGEHLETARRFLVSSKSSFESRDYELAASQLEKAVGEMEAGGASRADIESAQLMLAQATVKTGDLDRAYELCQGLQHSSVSTRVQPLIARIGQEKCEHAMAILAEAGTDLENGRLTSAGEKAGEASEILGAFGGSQRQLQVAAAIAEAARAGRVASERPAPSSRRQASELPSRPRHRGPRPGEAGARSPRVPVHRPRLATQAYPTRLPAAHEQEQSQQPPANFPMVDAMRRRRGGSPYQMPSGRPLPRQPQGAPEEAPASRPALPRSSAPSSQASSESHHTRAGSEDVLPTYNNQGGGSVY
jgi:hypothetical protein